MKRLLAAALLACLLAGRAGAEPVAVDGVTAWVDGKPITIMDVLREAQPKFGALLQEKGLSRSEMNARRMAIFVQVRRNLVDNELIYASYQKQNKSASAGITDQMVQARIDETVRDGFEGSREKLMKALAEERQTYEEWRERMTRGFIIQGMRSREITAKIQITPQAIEDYYQAHKAEFEHPGEVLLRRIVIKESAAEARSRVLMDRLAAGEDFVALAKSKAGGNDPAGGLWGWRAESDLSPALIEKIKVMRVGGIARIDLEGDWYLIKLEARERVPLRDAHAVIEEKLRRLESQRMMEAWMEKLEREFHVKFIDQPLWDD